MIDFPGQNGRASSTCDGRLARDGRAIAKGRYLFLRFVQNYRARFAVVAVCSILINILTFAGSLYMLLVYDSVLPSRSVPTLTGLFVMLVVIFLFQFAFEQIRSEALLGIANHLRSDLFRPVHYATINSTLRRGKGESDRLQPIRDLDQVHAFLSGMGPAAIIDLPWVLLFLIVLTALHWTLGLTALLGTLVLTALTLATNRRTESGTRDLTIATGRRSEASLTELRLAESAWAMGMQRRLIDKTCAWDGQLVQAQTGLSRTMSKLGGAGRLFRVFLQSVVLTVGALLVIDGDASGGVIIAASVLTGRALAPVDQAIANWRSFAAARSGWARLVALLAQFPQPEPRSVRLARPHGALELQDVWVAPPGSQLAVVAGASLQLRPGQALAVVGPSAAGKSSLAKTILGIWKPQRGDIRIDGATYDQWDADEIGGAFGYVAQQVELVEGTVAENIARFDPEATSDLVIAAARAAGLHDIILGLPDGYETRLGGGTFELSAGQRQRFGLARALYRDPHLVVLDEANSNLDAAGDEALARAIEGVKARGGMVVMITHRPATLGPVTHIALMQAGRIVDLDTRDAVLARLQGKPAQGKPAQGGVPA
ncbi:MAG: hypothetical protein RL702_466 [Pseudomonadota bacterium]